MLYEFMIEKINIKLPKWIDGLSADNEHKISLFNQVPSSAALLSNFSLMSLTIAIASNSLHFLALYFSPYVLMTILFTPKLS